MLYYRANSAMYLSNCLIRVVPTKDLVAKGYGDESKDEIEIVRDSLNPKMIALQRRDEERKASHMMSPVSVESGMIFSSLEDFLQKELAASSKQDYLPQERVELRVTF